LKWVPISTIIPIDTHFILKASLEPTVWTSLSFISNHIQLSFSRLVPYPFSFLDLNGSSAGVLELPLSRHFCSEPLPFSLPVRRLLLFRCCRGVASAALVLL
jgi:hypothetical protein